MQNAYGIDFFQQNVPALLVWVCSPQPDRQQWMMQFLSIHPGKTPVHAREYGRSKITSCRVLFVWFLRIQLVICTSCCEYTLKYLIHYEVFITSMSVWKASPKLSKENCGFDQTRGSMISVLSPCTQDRQKLCKGATSIHHSATLHSRQTQGPALFGQLASNTLNKGNCKYINDFKNW